ncbi:MAG: hypothetical protein IPN76_08560 [Saprospiraceae bacterium]|nr:hypothetical protein [Saprospiraceae bacterium]
MKYLFFAIFLINKLVLFGQDSDYSICDCCTYSFFQDKNDFNDVLPPDEIKANNLKKLTIYTTSKQRKIPIDSSFKVVDAEYKEMIFHFNSDGYIVTKIVFNRRGHFHSIYEFERDSDNKILSKTFHYLDEKGNKTLDFLSERWIYEYSNSQLVKAKKLGSNYGVLPDSKSHFYIYAYDERGRVVSETAQLYYDAGTSLYYKSTTEYNDTTNTAVEKTKDKDMLTLIAKTKYSESNKPLSQEFFDGRDNKMFQEVILTYNMNEQLINHQVKSMNLGTECADGGNFVNAISYSPKNLIDKILHQYENTVCELRFDYQ